MNVNSKNKFAVYPNPANNYIQVSTDGNPGKIIIYDQLGSAVMESSNPENGSQVNISSLANGIYTATYNNGTDYQRVKFVKQ